MKFLTVIGMAALVATTLSATVANSRERRFLWWGDDDEDNSNSTVTYEDLNDYSHLLGMYYNEDNIGSAVVEGIVEADWDVIRDVAKHLVTFTSSALAATWNVAKLAAEQFISTELFDEAVDKLISLITSETTKTACDGICNTAISTIPAIGGLLANQVCPYVCDGAIAKLQDATEQVADMLDGEEQA